MTSPLVLMGDLSSTTPDVAAEITRGLNDVALPPLVMIVDDHADTREMLKFAVQLKGCRVVEAGDGEEAVRLADRLQPTLILMDTGLPKVDGLTATARIRKLKRKNKVTIIFVSGYAHSHSRDLALAAGGDDYFTKPLNLDEFGRALDKYLITA